MRAWVLGAAWWVASSASGQQTWVVDLDGRPGHHFRDLPPAVAAAQAGDAIWVRYTYSGYYTAPVIRRGIRIATEGTMRLRGVLLVEDVPAGEQVTLVTSVMPYDGVDGGIVARRVAGRLHLEAVSGFYALLGSSTRFSYQFTDCSLVSIVDSQLEALGASVRFERTNVAIENSIVRSGWLTWPGSYGTFASRLTGAVLVDSMLGAWRTRFEGVDSLDPSGPLCIIPGQPYRYPGLDLTRSTVFLGPATTVTGGRHFLNPYCGGIPSGCYLNSIGGSSGTVVLDPVVVVVCNGTTPLTMVNQRVHVVETGRMVAGSPATVRVTEEPGSLVAVVIARSATQPIWIPPGIGPLFLDPSLAVVIGFGVIGPSGTATWSFGTGPLRLGDTPVFHSVVQRLGGRILTSLPGMRALTLPPGTGP